MLRMKLLLLLLSNTICLSCWSPSHLSTILFPHFFGSSVVVIADEMVYIVCIAYLG